MSVEARTGLAGIIVVMRMYVAPVDSDKIIYEFRQGGFLSGCARIGVFSVIIEASDVADTDTMGVVADAVGSSPANRSAAFNRAIKPYDVVIPYISPPSSVGFRLGVPLLNLFGSNIDLWPCGRTVYNYVIYHSHSHSN